MDNFVDRLFGGEHYEEIRSALSHPGASSVPLHHGTAVAPFHVKHFQIPAQRIFCSERAANSWSLGLVSSTICPSSSAVLFVTGSLPI